MGVQRLRSLKTRLGREWDTPILMNLSSVHYVPCDDMYDLLGKPPRTYREVDDMPLILSEDSSNTHTHTHTHIYIYIYIYINVD